MINCNGRNYIYIRKQSKEDACAGIKIFNYFGCKFNLKILTKTKKVSNKVHFVLSSKYFIVIVREHPKSKL